jgi:hypothetical protein
VLLPLPEVPEPEVPLPWPPLPAPEPSDMMCTRSPCFRLEAPLLDPEAPPVLALLPPPLVPLAPLVLLPPALLPPAPEPLLLIRMVT